MIVSKGKIFHSFLFFCAIVIFCGASVFSVSANGAKKLGHVGVQLYTVQSEMEKDFEGTLKRVAALGYDEVEFAGLFGHDPREVHTLVGKLGMKIVSSHINSEILKTNPEAAIEETKSLGAKYMVLAWIPPEQRQTLADWNNWVILINRVGKMCDEKGIRFLYHNHNFEFEKVEGVEPYDLLLEKADRRYVGFELDIYWLKLAGREPEPLFARYPKGFPLSHVKDMSKDKRAMVDVGDGKIDFAKIFKQSKISGMNHYFVEHDDTKVPFETLEKSIKYLRGLKF